MRRSGNCLSTFFGWQSLHGFRRTLQIQGSPEDRSSHGGGGPLSRIAPLAPERLSRKPGVGTSSSCSVSSGESPRYPHLSISHLTIGEGSSLNQVLQQEAQRCKTQGTVIILSDFMDANGYEKAQGVVWQGHGSARLHDSVT